MKYDQCCLQGSDFKVVISQLTEKFITFIKTSLESTGHLRWEFPDRAFDIAEIFKNSFLDERIISCQIKIIKLISCVGSISKFLIVENLKDVI